MANGDAQNPMAPILQFVQPKREVPMGEALSRQIQEHAQSSPIFDAQREGIKETQAAIEQLKTAPKANQNLGVLAALTDIISGTGTQYSQLYNTMKPKDKSKQELELQKLLDKKQRGLTDDQLKFMQNQMVSVGQTPGVGQALGKSLTPFEKKRDEAFAKDVALWNEGGGFAKVAGNIEALKDVEQQLGEPGDLTNTLKPEWFRKFAPEFVGGDPESVAAEQQVGFVVQQSLKEILGGQFSEKEGQQLIKRSYDPALSDTQNQKKLAGLTKRLEMMAKAKQDAIDHAVEFGTLKGFKGSSAESLDEWTKEQADKLKKDFKIKDTKASKKNPSFEEWKKMKGHQ